MEEAVFLGDGTESGTQVLEIIKKEYLFITLLLFIISRKDLATALSLNLFEINDKKYCCFPIVCGYK